MVCRERYDHHMAPPRALRKLLSNESPFPYPSFPAKPAFFLYPSLLSLNPHNLLLFFFIFPNFQHHLSSSSSSLSSLMATILSSLFLFLAMVAGSSGSAGSPSSSSMDCSNSLLNLANCLTFVQNGSTVSKPDGGCCSGLKTVLKDETACLCDAFKNSNNYGVSLNMTRAMSLPSACGISSSALSQCAVTGLPVAAPSHAPASPKHSLRLAPALSPTVVTTPPPVATTTPALPPSSAPKSSGGIIAEGPAPAPSQSGNPESAVALSVLSIVLTSLAVAMSLYF